MYILSSAARTAAPTTAVTTPMYKAFRYLWVVLALALAPLPLAGQQSSQAPGAERNTRREIFDDMDGPVEFLLRNRVVLSLNTDQVTRLQEIDRQMTERNRPYVMQLLQIRRQIPRRARESEMTPQQVEAYRAQLRAAQPLLERIRENNHVAMMDVGKVLTEPQKTRLREILSAERKDDGGRDSRGRSDDRRD